MSTLLEQASLVMIPSGYKEDVVYSQIPTTGAGDLSFTRASNGTRVNSAGLVEVCPWNDLTYSEEFDNAAWSKYQSTITANATTAPNGTTTAEKFNDTAVSDAHIIYRSASLVANTYTLTIYAKAAERSVIYMRFDNSTAKYAYFDLANGVVLSANAAYTASIQNAGNGWYRCSVAITATAATYDIVYGVTTGNGVVSYLGNGTGIYIWGAQLNIGSTAKPYFPTTDRLNVPRLTYQNGGGGCPSLLLEKQSTNVETWSEDFSNASWTKTNCSITANTTTSPDGTQNADKIIENSVNGVHFTFNVGATLSVAQTLSVYAKADTRTQLALQLGASSVIYNLSSGTIVSGSGGAIENAGNGWYRCSITTTPANTNALIFTANGGTNSYQGDGTSGLFIYGAQLEASSYPTSYIPTTSSSATRVADACFKTGISSLIGQTSGSVFLIIPEFVAQPSGGAILSLHDGSSANRMGVIVSGSQIIVYIITSNVEQAAYTFTPSSGVQKIAFAYANNDVAIYVNGSAVYTDTSATIPATSAIALNTYGFVNIHAGNSINEVALFKTRLTNTELASITTI